jgi:uncharacterized membrane protein
MRGLAVVIMIQCHTFNSLTRLELRGDGGYILSQFIGGMAAPLFLFMAGMTLAFGMDSLERREPSLLKRWLVSLKRAGYIWGIAYLSRFTNWAPDWRSASAAELTKVDILNCMGLAMAVLAVGALFGSTSRVRFGVLAGLAIAALAPVVANLDWSGVPSLIHEYLAPGQGRGRFAFFPCASYVAFGLAMGGVVRRMAAENMDRLMQWTALLGLALALVAQYFSNAPYSIYEKSNFWTDSPGLILIRTGLMLLMLAGSYVWTEFCAGAGWSWMITLGKTSLMVYWVHVVMVYGGIASPIRRALNIGQTAAVTAALTALMVGMAAAWLYWKERRRKTAA